MSEAEARAAVVAARDAYGQVLAWLAHQWRDVAAAEDALSDAFEAALRTWPEKGVPASPQAWLLTAARNRLRNAARGRKMTEDPARRIVLERAEGEAPTETIPDTRLRLMFVCAHPAIDRSMHTPLMLQTVLGIEAARLAKVMMLAPETMTKRLVRVKAKIKTAGLRFEEPEPAELPDRTTAVLDAIYGAYTLETSLESSNDHSTDLGEEAVFLADLVAGLMPNHAEALGLLALLLFCEARRPARLDEQGVFVPLDLQDPSRWDAHLHHKASTILERAARFSAPGPFQIEAAIQSAHCHRIYGQETPWNAVLMLYEMLLARWPTLGAHLGHALALARAHDNPADGLAALDSLDDPGLDRHQSWWATRAYLLERAGRSPEALEATWKALERTTDLAVRRYLEVRIGRLREAAH